MSPTTLLANRYRTLQVLGEGAMGLVWQVEDTTHGQRVALKVISQNYGTTAKSVLQFKQEFRLMTLLRHPNCCAVYDYGVLSDGEPYFTMEEVPGHGLDELSPMPPERVRQVLPQLLLALGYVHQRGFVHRDLKSANVRVRPDGSVKLMDYGLMEYARRTGGLINGTPAYLAPEVIKRGSIDQRTDLYAVGVLAYEMLTGRVPFDHDAPLDVLRAHLEQPPVPPSAIVPGLDPALEAIVLKLLAKNPLDRFQSAYQVLEALGAEVPAGIGGNLLASPMMGREPEMALLTDKLKAIARAEAGDAVMLHGPSGIGKSRLVEEFRYAVQLEDLPCVVGANYEQGNAPYAPFVAVLKSLLPALRAHVPDELDRHGSVLVQLLPELGATPAEELDSPTKDKLRLQATIAEVMAALSARRPFVVVLEDWQWADDLSAQLLDYLLRNTAGAPIMIVLTSRTNPEGRLERVTPVAVSHLDTQGIRRMVTAMLGTEDVHPRFLDQLGELSKGVPFFVEKLLEHLVQDMTLVNTRGRWNTDAELPVKRLPNNLKGLLMWRITCLPETAQLLAHVGAVVGRDFSLDLLQKVSGVSDDALFAALEALALNQVFIQNAEGSYQFAQDQIQELLYATLDASEKRRWHTAVAETLESHVAQLPTGEVPLELVNPIAHHYLAGETAAKTIVWALEAGRRSAGLFANAEAEQFLTGGLALVKAAPNELYRHERLEYWRLLGDVRRVTGRNADAKEAYTEAIALAADIGEYFHLGRMLTFLGRCHQVLGAFPEALESCKLSLEVTRANGDMAGNARCLVQMGRIHYFMGNLTAAIEHAEEALALARETGNRGQEGEALGMIGYFYVASDPDKVAEGVVNLNQSVAILTELGDKIATVNSYNFLGTAQNMLGDHLDALESFTQNRRIAHEIGAKDDEIFAWLNLAITAFELGDFLEMEQMAKAAQAIAAQLNSKFPLGMAATLHAVASAYLGDVASARERIAEALALATELNHKYMQGQVLMYQVDILMQLGRLDEARRQGQAWQALLVETGDKEPEARLNLFMSELLGRQGELAGARAYVERALTASVAAHAKGMQVRVLAAMAWLSLLESDWRGARRMAEEALGIAKAIGSQYQMARLHLLIGRAMLAGGQEGALPVYESALAIAQTIGAKSLEALARFGLAASDPYGGSAAEHVASAQALLHQLAEPLDEAGRACFLSLNERQLVLGGDYIGFGLPARDGTSRVSPSRLVMNQGLWKMQ